MSMTLGAEVNSIRLESVPRTKAEYKRAALAIWVWMNHYDLFNKVFYDSDRKLTLENIEGLLFSGRVYMIKEKDKSLPSGFILLSSLYRYRAEITFCSWPPFWGENAPEKGRLIMKQLIDMPENQGLLNLYGFISELNTSALEYGLKIGFKIINTFTNGYVDHRTNRIIPITMFNYSIKRS